MPNMNKAQEQALKRSKKIMLDAKKLHQEGSLMEAVKMLEKGLKIFTGVINGKDKKIDDVPQSMYRLQSKMATELGKWKHELKVREAKIMKAEGSKSETRHHPSVLKSERQEKLRKIVKEFMSAMNKHKNEKEVKVLIATIGEMSKTFLRSGDFTTYKKACNDALNEHKKKYYKMHHHQPKGVFEHIVNAVRAMFHLLEKMVNYVFGTRSSMFSNKTPLGKAVKDFQHELNSLQEYQEPKATHHLKK